MKEVAIIGATGVAGQVLLKLFSDLHLPAPALFGSPRSAGKRLSYGSESLPIAPFQPENLKQFSFVFLFANEHFSRQWAPQLAKQNRHLIDSSAAWRNHPDVPLILAGLNEDQLLSETSLIASPNCSTILAMRGLWPLHQKFGLEGFCCCSYQSVSGSGQRGIETLKSEMQTFPRQRFKSSPYDEPIAHNVIAQIGPLGENRYSEEESQIADESRILLRKKSLKISATCVRVPVYRGHCMAIQACFRQRPDLLLAEEVFAKSPTIQFCADEIPTPLKSVGQTRYLLGRLRRDTFLKNGLAFWICGDQLLGGAALNCLKIAQKLNLAIPNA